MAGYHIVAHTHGPGQGQGTLFALAEISEPQDGDTVLRLIDNHAAMRKIRMRPVGVGKGDDIRLVELF